MLVDKPAGPTSHDVVARARKLFRTRAVGHTGTLDPFATGLLVLVFGGATRLARWVERRRKTYRAVVRLGVVTDTDDATGQVVEERMPEAWPARAEVEAALGRLTGAQRQRPPAFSAKRIDGQRSYRLARRGERPEPPPVEVMVHRLELLEYAPPMVTLRAEVGSGTYVRALGRDLGALLGCGAHVTELRRERLGTWSVEEAVPLAALTGAEVLHAPAELVADLTAVELEGDEVHAVGFGRNVKRPGPTEGEAALLSEGRLVAVAVAVPEGWHPSVVLG
ncbi:MAG: tRNA pseudouridine(55) synthase TruB [Gemmatimonadales bacterium]|nr:tRNA pseudouridine(55) synthase TruB [Gemmatimonadales bacterium]